MIDWQHISHETTLEHESDDATTRTGLRKLNAPPNAALTVRTRVRAPDTDTPAEVGPWGATLEVTLALHTVDPETGALSEEATLTLPAVESPETGLTEYLPWPVEPPDPNHVGGLLVGEGARRAVVHASFQPTGGVYHYVATRADANAPGGAVRTSNALLRLDHRLHADQVLVSRAIGAHRPDPNPAVVTITTHRGERVDTRTIELERAEALNDRTTVGHIHNALRGTPHDPGAVVAFLHRQFREGTLGMSGARPEESPDHPDRRRLVGYENWLMQLARRMNEQVVEELMLAVERFPDTEHDPGDANPHAARLAALAPALDPATLSNRYRLAKQTMPELQRSPVEPTTPRWQIDQLRRMVRTHNRAPTPDEWYLYEKTVTKGDRKIPRATTVQSTSEDVEHADDGAPRRADPRRLRVLVTRRDATVEKRTATQMRTTPLAILDGAYTTLVLDERETLPTGVAAGARRTLAPEEIEAIARGADPAPLGLSDVAPPPEDWVHVRAADFFGSGRDTGMTSPSRNVIGENIAAQALPIVSGTGPTPVQSVEPDAPDAPVDPAVCVARVALTDAHPGQHEDGIVVSQSCAERIRVRRDWTFNHTPRLDGAREIPWTKEDHGDEGLENIVPTPTPEQIAALDPSTGIIRSGAVVRRGDPIRIAKVAGRWEADRTPHDGVVHHVHVEVPPHGETHVPAPAAQGADLMEGVVRAVTGEGATDDAPYVPHLHVKIHVSREGALVSGDKLGGPDGWKGLARVVPDEEMPVDDAGRPADVAVSSQGLAKRGTLGVFRDVRLGHLLEDRLARLHAALGADDPARALDDPRIQGALDTLHVRDTPPRRLRDALALPHPPDTAHAQAARATLEQLGWRPADAAGSRIFIPVRARARVADLERIETALAYERGEENRIERARAGDPPWTHRAAVGPLGFWVLKPSADYQFSARPVGQRGHRHGVLEMQACTAHGYPWMNLAVLHHEPLTRDVAACHARGEDTSSVQIAHYAERTTRGERLTRALMQAAGFNVDPSTGAMRFLDTDTLLEEYPTRATRAQLLERFDELGRLREHAVGRAGGLHVAFNTLVAHPDATVIPHGHEKCTGAALLQMSQSDYRRVLEDSKETTRVRERLADVEGAILMGRVSERERADPDFMRAAHYVDADRSRRPSLAIQRRIPVLDPAAWPHHRERDQGSDAWKNRYVDSAWKLAQAAERYTAWKEIDEHKGFRALRAALRNHVALHKKAIFGKRGVIARERDAGPYAGSVNIAILPGDPATLRATEVGLPPLAALALFGEKAAGMLAARGKVPIEEARRLFDPHRYETVHTPARRERACEILRTAMLGEIVATGRSPVLNRGAFTALTPKLIDPAGTTRAAVVHPSGFENPNADADGDNIRVWLMHGEQRDEARRRLAPHARLLDANGDLASWPRHAARSALLTAWPDATTAAKALKHVARDAGIDPEAVDTALASRRDRATFGPRDLDEALRHIAKTHRDDRGVKFNEGLWKAGWRYARTVENHLTLSDLEALRDLAGPARERRLAAHPILPLDHPDARARDDARARITADAVRAWIDDPATLGAEAGPDADPADLAAARRVLRLVKAGARIDATSLTRAVLTQGRPQDINGRALEQTLPALLDGHRDAVSASLAGHAVAGLAGAPEAEVGYTCWLMEVLRYLTADNDVVHEGDCGSKGTDPLTPHPLHEGAYLAEPVTLGDDAPPLDPDTALTADDVTRARAAGVTWRVRTADTCEHPQGLCRACAGADPGTGAPYAPGTKPVEIATGEFFARIIQSGISAGKSGEQEQDAEIGRLQTLYQPLEAWGPLGAADAKLIAAAAGGASPDPDAAHDLWSTLDADERARLLTKVSPAGARALLTTDGCRARDAWTPQDLPRGAANELMLEVFRHATPVVDQLAPTLQRNLVTHAASLTEPFYASVTQSRNSAVAGTARGPKLGERNAFANSLPRDTPLITPRQICESAAEAADAAAAQETKRTRRRARPEEHARAA